MSATHTSYVARRGDRQQGIALEKLGHAIEYLLDSRAEAAVPVDSRPEVEAVRILSRLSYTVFLECREVKPLRQRLREWLVGNPAPARVRLGAGASSALGTTLHAQPYVR